MRRQLVVLAVVFLLSLSGRSAWGQAALYTVTDVGTLSGGTTSQAYGINASGQVVGDAQTASGDTHAFLYSTGAGITDLSTLGGTNSYGRGINNAGSVVGFSQIGDNAGTHAFLHDGTMHDLGTFSGGTNSYAYAINNASPAQIVGGSDTAPGPSNGGTPGVGFGGHAASFSSGSNAPTDFGTLLGGTTSCAYGINTSGHVVGFSQTASGANHAFLYYNSQNVTDIGALLGGIGSCAYGINDADHVVGYVQTSSGANHAFLYKDGTAHDLGTVGSDTNSYAYGINNKDQIVGSSGTGDGERAFLDDSNGITDLNSLIGTNSGWILDEARGINDSGQIVGWGNFDGNIHAFLLTPVMVPEPSAIVLLGIGGVSLLAYGWRRRSRTA